MSLRFPIRSDTNDNSIWEGEGFILLFYVAKVVADLSLCFQKMRKAGIFMTWLKLKACEELPFN